MILAVERAGLPGRRCRPQVVDIGLEAVLDVHDALARCWLQAAQDARARACVAGHLVLPRSHQPEVWTTRRPVTHQPSLDEMADGRGLLAVPSRRGGPSNEQMFCSRCRWPRVRILTEGRRNSRWSGVSGWRCIFLPGRHDDRRAEGIEGVPVAALRASASAGADGPIVALSGEADATTAAELRETLATQLGTGARLLTVDASGLSFLDSASLRVLILAARALRGRHGRLVFARPQPLVARLLEITGADRLLEVQE
jgi:anti-anti-sigma factor